MQITEAKSPGRDTGTVLTQAILRAAELLDLTNAELARILGVSPSYVSKLRSGASTIQAESKTGELGVLFVRGFRSLDAIVGGDERTACNWLRNMNTALSAKPIDLLMSVSGLVAVVEYLDQRRAPL